jgi:carbonic anhydrase
LCGGIAALVDGRDSAHADYDYLPTWISIAQEVREAVVGRLAGRPRAEVTRALEQAAVVNSVSNLLTFRWIAERVAAGSLSLHAWWFNLVEGQLYALDPDTTAFEPVLGVELAPAVTQGTSLARFGPRQFVSALAGRKPAF